MARRGDINRYVGFAQNLLNLVPGVGWLLGDDQFTLRDNADPSKRAQFQASGISGSTTRTYALPNANTSLAHSPSGSNADVDSLSTAITALISAATTAAARSHFTLGPFYLNDVPGTATSEMVLGFMDSATSFVQGGTGENDFVMPQSGKINGAWLLVDDPRTAGTATLRVRLNGTATAFLLDTLVLNATHTTRNGTVAAIDGGFGFAFTAGDRIGAALVTSGWTPTTANAVVWLHGRYDAI